jgi:hypothetical protein
MASHVRPKGSLPIIWWLCWTGTFFAPLVAGAAASSTCLASDTRRPRETRRRECCRARCSRPRSRPDPSTRTQSDRTRRPRPKPRPRSASARIRMKLALVRAGHARQYCFRRGWPDESRRAPHQDSRCRVALTHNSAASGRRCSYDAFFRRSLASIRSGVVKPSVKAS